MDRSHGRIGHASRPGVGDRAPERLVRRRARVPRRREALRRPSMVHARLAIKIGLLIVVVLIIGFGASMLVTIQRESVALIDQNKIGARRLTMAVVASVEGAMLQERPDVTRTMIQQLKSSSFVEGFTIYRRNGVEAFTDLATAGEVERRAGLAPDVLAKITKMQRAPGAPMTGPLFARALETLGTQESIEVHDGVSFFTLHYPIPNREACQGCHGSDHTVRAVVRVEASMEPVYAEVRRLRNRQILIGVLTIVSAAIVLTVAMRSVIVRPIEALAAAARRVGEGDFAVRAPAGARDEIGELGAAFNEMTGRLARAHEDLGAKNTELESALRNLQESRARLELLEQLKGELSKFVPDAVKKLLEQNPNATELEKKSVEVSVLFLDIAGYTKLSEQLDPKRLNQLVQTYFSSYLEIVQGHHGDVNETAGDGLMDERRRALRRVGAGWGDRHGPDDGRAHPSSLRPREHRGEDLQERLAGDPRLPRHPTRHLRKDRLAPPSACESGSAPGRILRSSRAAASIRGGPCRRRRACAITRASSTPSR